jgi:hypothetical protein
MSTRTICISIVLLIVLGELLDIRYLDIPIKENARLAIIRFYVWLYELVGNIPEKIEDLLYQFHKAPE